MRIKSPRRNKALPSLCRQVGVYILVLLVLILVASRLVGLDDSVVVSSSTLELLALPATAAAATTTTKTAVPTTPRINKLPDLSKGGIIIFFHIPKTGGSSIKDAARLSPNLEYNSNERRRNNKGGMEAVKKSISEWVQDPMIIGEGKQAKFVELHWDLESALSLDEQLSKWRMAADANGIPFFVFAMVRAPLDTYLSFFNFFCIYLHKGGHVKCPGPYNAERLRAVSPDNPQSRWLCHAVTMNFENKELPAIQEECQPKLIPMMQRQFDWVGDLNRFSDTLAVFEAMGLTLNFRHNNKIKGMEKVEKSDLSEQDRLAIESDLVADQELVHWTAQTYTLDHFAISSSPPMAEN